MCYQALKRHGGNLHYYYLVLLPEISQSEKLFIVWFQKYLCYPRSGKTMETIKKKKKRFVQDCGKKGMNSRKQRIFMSVKTILFDSLMFDICYYIVVKTHTRNIKWVSLCVCVCVDGGTWEHCNFQSVLLWNCSKNVY